MRKNLLFNVKPLLVFVVILGSSMMSSVLIADSSLPEGVVQVWTSVEGNIKYYVKEGDEVKKGTPLFYIENCDNSPALFWETEHKIDYYKKLYLRRKKLSVSHSISQEEVDNALQNLIEAQDSLTTLVSKAEQGFYVAPFDCKITKLLYLQGSGINDGSPAINIKCTDKNYKFEPPKPSENLVKILKKRDELMKEREKSFNINELDL